MSLSEFLILSNSLPYESILFMTVSSFSMMTLCVCSMLSSLSVSLIPGITWLCREDVWCLLTSGTSSSVKPSSLSLEAQISTTQWSFCPGLSERLKLWIWPLFLISRSCAHQYRSWLWRNLLREDFLRDRSCQFWPHHREKKSRSQIFSGHIFPSALVNKAPNTLG